MEKFELRSGRAKVSSDAEEKDFSDTLKDLAGRCSDRTAYQVRMEAFILLDTFTGKQKELAVKRTSLLIRGLYGLLSQNSRRIVKTGAEGMNKDIVKTFFGLVREIEELRIQENTSKLFIMDKTALAMKICLENIVA